jgi:hypothetical protein
LSPLIGSEITKILIGRIIWEEGEEKCDDFKPEVENSRPGYCCKRGIGSSVSEQEGT